MKVLYSCVLLLALFAASQAYSATWGRRNGTDYLIDNQRVVRAPQKNNVQTVTIDFPTSGSNSQWVITCINVTDNFRNSSGAAPNLWSGGPGYRFAQINLKSVLSQGIDSTVQIYGR